MKILSFSKKIFRGYGILPLDGADFDRFKLLENLRVILLPFPSFLMGIAQLAYFVVNIRDLGKATVALYCGFGFLNSILGYLLAVYHRRKFLALLNDMQATVDQSAYEIWNFHWNLYSRWWVYGLNDFQGWNWATNAFMSKWTETYERYRWYCVQWQSW